MGMLGGLWMGGAARRLAWSFCPVHGCWTWGLSPLLPFLDIQGEHRVPPMACRACVAPTVRGSGQGGVLLKLEWEAGWLCQVACGDWGQLSAYSVPGGDCG